ncbi:hypothetical protein K491DRAFT_585988 [Lophiostoma macrostomum CBS 122681]|uniref:Uncharacterized protein n=1 Tax=Lophiostoma macrostomum CBS 122681 TaxID=1314788 RepID=A0A6A6TSR8_9PLEO|nr:hypothetical protein K491DRAFT_585988 [Lophiostoma macrostomum CBS 122681]
MAVARRAASQSLGLRSVHLRIQPRPANLSESREIYRVMQRFGEISTYKHLRYEYHSPADNIALAIYRDADAAQAALNASPLRFSLERIAADISPSPSSSSPEDSDDASAYNDRAPGASSPRPPPTDDIDDIMRPGHLLNPLPSSLPSTSLSPTRPAPLPLAPAPTILKTSQKYFQITLDRSRVVHQDFVQRQPYWKQFEPMRSLAQEELRKVVPLLGLSDVSRRPPNAHRTPNHVLRLMSEYVDRWMPRLSEMYEEGGAGVGSGRGGSERAGGERGRERERKKRGR